MTSNNPIGLLLTTSYVFISSVFMSLSIADCGCKVKKVVQILQKALHIVDVDLDSSNYEAQGVASFYFQPI